MTGALFIDDTYIKQYTPIGLSIDVNDIYSFISVAQDIYVQDTLGTPLYNYLVDKLVNEVAYTTKEEKLIDLFSISLAYWSIYQALPHLSIKIRNTGVAKTKSDMTETSTLSELKYIREEMKNMAEFYMQRVVNFLCDNSKDFPLYNAISKDMYPTNRQYDSDIYIEDGIKDYTLDELRLLKKYLS
jgi:hypothetical protein